MDLNHWVDAIFTIVDKNMPKKKGILIVMPVHNTPNRPHISPAKILVWREKK